jgi:hypothetical protein
LKGLSSGQTHLNYLLKNPFKIVQYRRLLRRPKGFLVLFSINTRLRWSQSIGFAIENPTPVGLRVYRIIQIKRLGLRRSLLSRLKGIKNALNYLDAFAQGLSCSGINKYKQITIFRVIKLK